MTGLGNLIKRNIKLFFKDKGMFFSSLITPIILLVLYVTFLAGVYRDSFNSAFSGVISDGIINALVGGQLVSSLLAVSCVTVSFCSNLLIVQDKTSGARKDITVSPVKKSTLALSYFLSSAVNTLVISFTALAVCFIYMLKTGWYMNFKDVLLIMLDVLLLTLFGTSLSSCVNFFLSTNGQASAVGTVVSAGYGFVCGAYMPISNFSPMLQKILSFLPGTYGTVLLRGHCLGGIFREMQKEHIPLAAIDEIKKSIDCTLFFFDRKVGTDMMYCVLCGAITLFVLLYILMNKLKKINN